MVRCTCETRFAVKLEFRRDFRKQSDLSGEYLCLPKGKPRGKMKIVNISQDGICGQISDSQQFNVGDKLLVWFTLNDSIDSLIEKNVTIKRVQENYIGCEFLGSSPPGKVLGKFLAGEFDEKEEVEEVDIEDYFEWTGGYAR
ncbi:MAG: PilZ domain-containing protein [Desulfobulbaceae bacterium]|nr:PilZ domain-containing protein [Desulfobulbaceae bacterium]